MLSLQNITSDPSQKRNIILPDGSEITIRMYFAPLQRGWYFRELTYQGFTINGLRITNSPNMLRQYKNQIPFGIACFTDEDREPSLREDFSSGLSQMFILTQGEVEAYEGLLNG